MDGDSRRFLNQSYDLVAGAGEAFRGDPFSTLPPGYPLFIRAIRGLGGGLHALLGVQFVLSVVTYGLAYLTFRRRRPTASLAAMAVLALNPWLARQQAAVMSETLAALLVALALWLFPAPGEESTVLRSCLLGITGTFLVLVAPACGLMAMPCGLVFLWRHRADGRRLAAAAGGAALILLPWQAYCLQKTGRFEPFVLHPPSIGKAGLTKWLQTWLVWPDGLSIWWSEDARNRLPAEAAQGADEFRAVQEVLVSMPKTIYRYVLDSSYDRQLHSIASRRRASDPVRVSLVLPLQRCVTIWIQFGELPGYARPARWRALASSLWLDWRASKTLGLSVGLWAWNVATLAMILLAARRLVRNPEPLLVAIVLGVAAYTWLSAVTAMGEFRRGLPFLPALALLLSSGPAECDRNGLLEANRLRYRRRPACVAGSGTQRKGGAFYGPDSRN